jgi:hypothetical protein
LEEIDDNSKVLFGGGTVWPVLFLYVQKTGFTGYR